MVWSASAYRTVAELAGGGAQGRVSGTGPVRAGSPGCAACHPSASLEALPFSVTYDAQCTTQGWCLGPLSQNPGVPVRNADSWAHSVPTGSEPLCWSPGICMSDKCSRPWSGSPGWKLLAQNRERERQMLPEPRLGGRSTSAPAGYCCSL